LTADLLLIRLWIDENIFRGWLDELCTGSEWSGNRIAVLYVEPFQNRVDIAALVDVDEFLTAISVNLHAEEVF
jgi:hypothetical protein